MVKITGGDVYLKRLRGMTSPAVKAAIDDGLLDGAFELAAVAKESIIDGGSSASGVHIPSKPGEPPSSDTGYLAANIVAEPVSQGIVRVISRANYSKYLEFGTVNMAARPFMRPALRKARSRINALVRSAYLKAIAGNSTATGKRQTIAQTRAAARKSRGK